MTWDRLVVLPDATLLEAIAAINASGHGLALVCDGDGRVVGTLTDGDVRRALLAGVSLGDRCLQEVAERDFVFVGPDAGRAEVLDLMLARSIRHVVVLDAEGRLVGLHLLQELIGRTVRDNWAVIMAGGRGTRLRPLTERVPKPMVRVAGRPILERLVLHLVGWGIRRIFLAVNYLAEVIEEHFEDGSRFGCRIEYLREDRPLGSGGALSLLPEAPTLPILVLNGDLVTDFDVGRFLDFHTSGGFEATVGVRPYSVRIPFGVVEPDGDELAAFQEKPTVEKLVNTGIYALAPDLVAMVPPDTAFPMTDLIERCVERGGRVGVHVLQGDWTDVGQLNDLRRARGEG